MRLRRWLRRVPGFNRRWISHDAERASQQALVVSRLANPQVDLPPQRRQTDKTAETEPETTSLALREP
jgi:hypothetical protein